MASLPQARLRYLMPPLLVWLVLGAATALAFYRLDVNTTSPVVVYCGNEVMSPGQECGVVLEDGTTSPSGSSYGYNRAQALEERDAAVQLWQVAAPASAVVGGLAVLWYLVGIRRPQPTRPQPGAAFVTGDSPEWKSAALVAFGLALGAVAIGLFQSGLDDMGWPNLIGGVAVALVLSLPALFLGITARRGLVVFYPDGLSIDRVGLSTFVPWHGISSIEPHTNRGKVTHYTLHFAAGEQSLQGSAKREFNRLVTQARSA